MDGWENEDLGWNEICSLTSGATAASPPWKMSLHRYPDTLPAVRVNCASCRTASGNGATFCHSIHLPYDRQYPNTPGAQGFRLAFTKNTSSVHAASIMTREKRSQVYLLDKYLFAGLSSKGSLWVFIPPAWTTTSLTAFLIQPESTRYYTA